MGDNSDRPAIFQVQIGYVVPTIIGITHKWEITLDRQAIFQVPIGNVLPTSQD